MQTGFQPEDIRVTDAERAVLRELARQVQDNYVYSMKPSPTPLACAGFDHEATRRELREAFATTSGCRVECIMKDNHTLGVG